MLKSIKTLVYLSFLIIGTSLFVVIVLGVRQYWLNDQYEEIGSLSERTLFGFATIREQVFESMIDGDYRELRPIIPDIEQLNVQVSRLYDHKMIPAQYKLAMTDSIDLSGLVIGLRKFETAPDRKAASQELQQRMRRIGENLIAVDRVITAHIRDSVIGFQLTIIGTMGILISLASFILICLYRRGVMPLLDLSSQVTEETLEERQRLSCAPDASVEIQSFVESVNAMFTGASTRNIERADGPDRDLLSGAMNETANNLNGIINYAQLLLEADSGLSAEQSEMLNNIVENAERISAHWQGLNQGFGR